MGTSLLELVLAGLKKCALLLYDPSVLAGFTKSLATEYRGRGYSANMTSQGRMNSELLSDLTESLTEQMCAATPGAQRINP